MALRIVLSAILWMKKVNINFPFVGNINVVSLTTATGFKENTESAE